MVARIGPLATLRCEPGQAWKGATAAADVCAGVWLVRVATLNSFIYTYLVMPGLAFTPRDAEAGYLGYAKDLCSLCRANESILSDGLNELSGVGAQMAPPQI